MTQNLFLLDETRAWLVRAAEDLAAAVALTRSRNVEKRPVPLPAGG